MYAWPVVSLRLCCVVFCSQSRRARAPTGSLAGPAALGLPGALLALSNPARSARVPPLQLSSLCRSLLVRATRTRGRMWCRVADGSLQNRKRMVHRSAVLSVTGCGCAVSLRLNPQNAHCQPAASRDTALLIIAPRRSEIALAGCPALATTAAAGHPPPPAPLLPRVELHSRRALPPRLHALPPHPPPGGKRRLHWATHTAVHARWLTPRTCAPPAEPLPGGPPRPRARKVLQRRRGTQRAAACGLAAAVIAWPVPWRRCGKLFCAERQRSLWGAS